MIEADIVQRRGGLKARDMAAEFGGLCLLARTTIASAFQRMIELMRRSISRSPGRGD
jgi:hypothetical protein